jgi:hypothetical protein
VLTGGARTRKARGYQGLEPIPLAAGGQERFLGRSALRTALFTHYEILKQCMMGVGGGITFVYVERDIIRR